MDIFNNHNNIRPCITTGTIELLFFPWQYSPCSGFSTYPRSFQEIKHKISWTLCNFGQNILMSTMNSKLLIMVLNRPPLSMWPIYTITFLDILFTSCPIYLLEPITIILMTNCLSVLLSWKCLLNHSMLLLFLLPFVH